jgi:hypothetical protein
MKKGKIHIGTFTKEDIIKSSRKASRELELVNSTGWVATHKVHKSVKDYKRNSKHKKDYSFE